MIPNVPQGPYLLRANNSYVVTSVRDLDLDYARAGRPDVVPATVDPTTLALDLTNLQPWGQSDSFSLICANAGVAIEDFAAYGNNVPMAGATSSTGFNVDYYPFSTSPFGVFVNTDLVRQAGRQTPAELAAAGRWNWDEAVAAAAAVNARTGKAGLVVRDFDYKTWDNLATVWTGWGAQAWSADGKACGFDKPEMVDAMTFLHKATFTDRALPGPGTKADFFAGEAGMTITQISRASLLKDAKFGWDLVPLPAGPKGPYAVIGQGGIGVLKKSRNAAAAADFLAFLTNPANSAKLARFFPPPRRSLLTADTLAKTNPLLKPEQLQKVVIDGISTGVVKPSHAGYAELTQAVRAGLDPLWKPDADVKAVLDKVCTSIQPLLAK